MEDEVGKYRKKKESSTSKSKYKSKHKHEYKSCLIRYYDKEFSPIQIASYCRLCGKIGSNIDSSRKMSEKTESGYYRMLTKDEIVKQNDDLPIFDLDDWDSKYVPLENI